MTECRLSLIAILSSAAIKQAISKLLNSEVALWSNTSMGTQRLYTGYLPFVWLCNHKNYIVVTGRLGLSLSETQNQNIQGDYFWRPNLELQ